MLPSARLPFLNIKTDGARKERHNRELLFFAGMLTHAGIKRLCMHHVKDAGMSYDLPLTYRGKWYDIAYVSPDGEIFMLELMRVGRVFPADWSPEVISRLKPE